MNFIIDEVTKIVDGCGGMLFLIIVIVGAIVACGAFTY